MQPLILTASDTPIEKEPGIYYGVPFDEYATWNAFSKSMVPAALKSGAHLDYYIRNQKSTSSLVFGNLVDCLVLEPEEFDNRYVMQPSTYVTEKTSGRGDAKKTEIIEKPWNLNSNTCKEIQAQIQATGKQIVSEELIKKAEAIRKALLSSPEAALSIVEGKRQVSFIWVDSKTGVTCKGRADIVTKDSIDDLKTAQDASPDEFQRAIGRFLYHVQAAAYTEAWKALTGEDKAFRFIVAETSEDTEIPEIGLYELDSVSIVAGGLMFRRALNNVKHWLEVGVKGYSPWFEPIEAPAWLVNRELSMTDEEIEL